ALRDDAAVSSAHIPVPVGGAGLVGDPGARGDAAAGRGAGRDPVGDTARDGVRIAGDRALPAWADDGWRGAHEAGMDAGWARVFPLLVHELRDHAGAGAGGAGLELRA